MGPTDLQPLQAPSSTSLSQQASCRQSELAYKSLDSKIRDINCKNELAKKKTQQQYAHTL